MFRIRVVSATFLGLPAPINVVEVPDHPIVSGGDKCRHVKGSFRTWPVPPHTLRLSPRIPLPRSKSATPTKGAISPLFKTIVLGRMYRPATSAKVPTG